MSLESEIRKITEKVIKTPQKLQRKMQLKNKTNFDFRLFDPEDSPGSDKANDDMNKEIVKAAKMKDKNTAYQHMMKIQKKHSKHGATDTEPREMIRAILDRVFGESKFFNFEENFINPDCDICGDGSPCTCGESQEVQEALDDKDVPGVKKIITKLKGASKKHADQAKSLEKEIEDDVKKESLDKTLEDLFQEGEVGEFDHLEEGYEAKVSKILNKKGIDHHWKNGKVYVSKRDEKSAQKILSKNAGPGLGTAVRMVPDIVGEETMQENNRFGLSQSLVDTVSKIIGGEKPEAMNPAQQAAIAIAKKKKGEKPKDEGNAFGKAVLAAKEAGKKDFIFSGKKYVVKDELDKVNPKAAAKKFDDRKDKDIDNDGDVDSSDKYLHKKRQAIGKAMKGKKEPVDTKPKMAEEVEVEEGMLKVSDFDGKKHAEKAGLKVKMGASSPFGGASATLSGPDDKLIKYAVQHLGGSGKTLKDVQKSLNEGMTDAQMKKREEIVMSLKKKMPEFEDKYGDKAKDVMYATATKIAMKSA